MRLSVSMFPAMGKIFSRWINRLLVIGGLVGLAIAIPAFCIPVWRFHSLNLLSRTEKAFLQGIGTTGLGFHAYWAVPSLGIIVGLVIVRRQRGKDSMLTHWQEAKLAGRILLIALSLYFVPILCWKFVAVIYGDHTDLASANVTLAGKNQELERQNQQFSDDLQTKCQDCKKSGSGRGSHAPVPVIETINDVLAEVRLTCSLVNPTKMPEDAASAIATRDSYLKGAIGKSALQSRANRYQRAEEEGKVTAIEDFRPPPQSDLIGRPVAALTNYSMLEVSDASVSGGIFSECTYVEVTLRVNGRDIFRHGQPINEKLGPENGLAFDMKLEGMNLHNEN